MSAYTRGRCTYPTWRSAPAHLQWLSNARTRADNDQVKEVCYKAREILLEEGYVLVPDTQWQEALLTCQQERDERQRSGYHLR